jgi:hypothetical protein
VFTTSKRHAKSAHVETIACLFLSSKDRKTWRSVKQHSTFRNTSHRMQGTATSLWPLKISRNLPRCRHHPSSCLPPARQAYGARFHWVFKIRVPPCVNHIQDTYHYVPSNYRYIVNENDGHISSLFWDCHRCSVLDTSDTCQCLLPRRLRFQTQMLRLKRVISGLEAGFVEGEILKL